MPGFVSDPDETVSTTDREEGWDIVREVLASNPSCRQEVVDVIATCDGRRATV